MKPPEPIVINGETIEIDDDPELGPGIHLVRVGRHLNLSPYEAGKLMGWLVKYHEWLAQKEWEAWEQQSPGKIG